MYDFLRELQGLKEDEMTKNKGKANNFSHFTFQFSLFVVPLHRNLRMTLLRRDGRVVDYTGLENRRTETCRGFESLSLRKHAKAND